MEDEKLLEGKKILIVDDEPDILEMLEELLFMCDVVRATNFQEAKRELETRHFDMAVLDIMGVGGYQLLEIANEKEIPAVMLTAHALSPEDTVKSFKEGAASYVPKDRIVDIQDYLADILKAQKKGKNARWLWLKKLASYYDQKFGPDWKRSDEKFWEKFVK